MATNPFKQAPAVPSTTQSSNTPHSYDEPDTPPFCTYTSAATPTTGSGGTTSATDSSSSSSNSILKQRATCACSNISIMQLFHEMKQKYPTVPDTVVSELVTQNCHDRPACIGKLEEAVLGTPAQTTYPAQSIHSGSLKRRERKLGGGNGRSDGSVSYSSSNSSSNSSRESSVDSSRLQGTACPATPPQQQQQQYQQGASMAGNHTGYSDSRFIVENRTAGGGSPANRPTTLAVRPPAGGYYGGGGPRSTPPPPMRPNRTAPPCPQPSGHSNGSLTTSTITTTASSSAELGETVNLQVNVTVSPKAGPGPVMIGGQQRHTSTISLQPEPPYSRELAQVSSTFSGGGGGGGGAAAPTAIAGTPGGPARGGSNGGPAAANGNGGRSSTSVNLTLRQPTDGRPRTPIHIHASPLKYTAKNFNAQSGIQSKLEVTFRDGFGSFSAMRAQVPGYEQQMSSSSSSSSPQRLQPEREASDVSLPDGHSGWYHQSPVASSSRVPLPYMLSGFPPPLCSSSPLPNVSAAHQLQTGRGAMAASLYGDGGRLENDGLSKEMRYQNFVVAEMAVSQQLEQKQRLSLEVERKRTQFESICREIFVLQQPLRYIDAELLDREVLLLAAEVEQLQKEVDTCDDEEARVQAAAAAGTSITDGLSALSVEGGSPLMLPTSVVSGAAVMNRPPRPPRPPPPRAPTQSPSRSGTPGTPHLSAAGFGGTSSSSPVPATPSSSSSSPCSTGSSSFASNGGAEAAAAASRLQPGAPAAGPNQPWTCSLCTFQNHELMPACEVCSLPKASGSRTTAGAATLNNGTACPPAFPVGADACDGGGGGPRAHAGALMRRQHLSVDTGVAAAAAAAAAAVVVGASVAGPSTAPPYPGIAEMAPPSFASLTGHGISSASSPSSSSSVSLPAVAGQQPQPIQQPQQQQQSAQQPNQQQPNPPPLQSAPYQKSSIEC
uniref:RanBP2-type domain-containing protein n=1 Tax=Anopheles quadriannulatus TaxID=34691 RepID=A0A904A3A8_ANOQN